jgi:hypothetical protein
VSPPSFKRRVGAGVVLLLGATTLGVWMALRAEPEVQADPPPMPSPTLVSISTSLDPPVPHRTAAEPAAEGSAPASLSEIDRLRIEGLTGPNPLVAIQALREMRVPGSFASAFEIARGCFDAQLAPQLVDLS